MRGCKSYNEILIKTSCIIELCSGRLESNNHPEIKKLLNGTRQVCLFSIFFYPYCYPLSFEDYEQVYCIELYTPVLEDESCKTTIGFFNQNRG